MLVPVREGSRFLAPVGRIDHFTGRWQKLRDQAPQALIELRTVAMIQSAGASTRIEGAQVSDAEVKRILDGLSIDSFRARDAGEVRGYGDLLQLIGEQYAELAITENNLKAFHRILLAHLAKDAYHRGDYKIGPNDVIKEGDGPAVVIFRTAGPAETQWWMPRLVAEFNQAWAEPGWHRLVLIADFILWLLAIHPFQDGNGRLARALTTLLLLRAGYEYAPYGSLEKVIENNKPAYYMALRTSQIRARSDVADYGEWLEFFLGSLASQQQGVEALMTKAARRQAMLPGKRKILDLISERGPMTAPTIGAELRMAERTVRYHLKGLTDAAMLEATTPTAGRMYALPLMGAADDAFPVVGVAGQQGREEAAAPASIAEGDLTPLDFDLTFQQHAASSPNGRVYATVVVGAAAPDTAPLGDQALDAFERLAKRLAPAGTAAAATPNSAWWRIEAQAVADVFQLWLYPGPLLIAHWALDAANVPSEAKVLIVCQALVAYWRTVLEGMSELFGELSVRECAVGMNLTTQPAGRPYPVGFDFGDLPTPVRSSAAHTPGAWRSAFVRTPTAELASSGVINAALDHLLRHFSYRHTAETIAVVAGSRGEIWRPEEPGSVAAERRGGASEAGPGPREPDVEVWVRGAVADLGFTEIDAARGALKQDVMGELDSPDFGWRTEESLLIRGANGLTRLELDGRWEMEALRYEEKVWEGRRELRGDAFALDVDTVGPEAFLRVLNEGPKARFRTELTKVAGLRETVRTPRRLQWSDAGEAEMELARGESGVVRIAKGEMERESRLVARSPVKWTLHEVGGDGVVHLADIRSSDQVFDLDLELSVRVRRMDTGRIADVALKLGLRRHAADASGILDTRNWGPFPVRAEVVKPEQELRLQGGGQPP
jgi:Fic family protein